MKIRSGKENMINEYIAIIFLFQIYIWLSNKFCIFYTLYLFFILFFILTVKYLAHFYRINIQ